MVAMSVIAWILIGFLGIVLGCGGYIFVKACVRGKEIPWMVEDEIKKTGFGRYYNCILTSDAWLKAHNAQDVWIKSKDGLQLHGYWVPAENPRGTVLLAHGYRSTFLVDFGLAFALYHTLGMNILVPNQRSHGESEGKFITFGVKESEDMACWIRYHNETNGHLQMILSGLSMGAATVLYLADRELPDNVKCIIADCGFTSPRSILDRVFRDTVHLPSGPFLWAADLFARIFAGFSLTEKDTRTVLKESKIPVLLIHGLDDDFVPSEMTVQAFEACTGEKDLLLVPGAGHGTSFLADKENYTKTVFAFLEKYLEDF